MEQRVIFGALPGTSGMPIAQPLPGPPPHLPREGPLAAPQILVPEEEIAVARRRLPPAPDYGWYLMGWLGLVFVIVGGSTLVMSWYPPLIGNPQWEFGTVSSTYDNLPITALGLGLLLGAGVAGYPAALAPLQILWLNLLTDTFPALALAVEPGDAGIMRKPPTDPRAAILPSPALWSAVGYAVLIALTTLGAFAWGLRRGDAAAAATLAFMTLAFAQIFHLGNARAEGPVLSPRRILANRYALGAAGLAVALQLLAALLPPLSRVLRVTPLSASDWLIVTALGLVPAVAGQVIKSVRAAGRA